MSTETTTPVTTPVTAPVKKIYTSPKLTELHASLNTAFDNYDNIPRSEEQAKLDANLEIYKIQQAIKAEIAGIISNEKAQELADKRNARVKMVDDLLAAHDANLLIQKDKNKTIDEKNASNDAFKAQKDVLTNELLARYSTSTPSKTATGTDGIASPKGEKSIAIRKILTDETAAGKTMAEAKKSAEAAGYTRGTVGTIATQMLAEATV